MLRLLYAPWAGRDRTTKMTPITFISDLIDSIRALENYGRPQNVPPMGYGE